MRGLECVDEGGRPGEHLGEAYRAVKVEGACHGRAPEVGIDEDDVLSGLGEHGREVGGDGRLALTLLGAGDDDGPRLVVDVDEAQVGAQLAQGLPLVEGLVAIRRPALGAEVLALGQDPEHAGARCLLDVLGPAELGVVVLAHGRQTEAHEQAQEQAERQDA